MFNIKKYFIHLLPMERSPTFIKAALKRLSLLGKTCTEHYSYDIHGNVKTLLQENPNLASISQQFKRIDYEYDLISGNVNQVKYQDGEPDAFYHKYEYDADNKITNVYTSKDNVIWEQDAKYFFYDHGVLSRTELGDNKVQGLDYAYTLQGWVKGVNSNNLNSNNDIGQDGEISTTNVNRNLTRDAFGYSLNYYNGDYQAIDPNKNLTANSFVASVTAAAYLQTDAPNLFNGNISSMVTSIKDIDPTNTVADGTPIPQLTAYRYDQLNRIKQMKAYRDMNLSANAWGDGSTYDASYENTFTYDANGNILTLKRNGVASTALGMDDFTYVYENIANGYIKNTNRLKHVLDAVPSGNYATDRDNHNANNFDYNEIGQLIKDEEKGIAHIEWTLFGKLKSVTRYNGSNKSDLEFSYDASGQLISKLVKPRVGGVQSAPSQWITIYYVRDAQGNIMADYKQENDAQTQTASFKLKERHIYGSSRIGVDKTEVELIGTLPQGNTFLRTLGKKNFELTTHRGDVATVISDRRIPVDANTDGTIDYCLPEILSTEETYPGGFEMPKRTQEPTLYQFSYNGKMDIQEMDDWQDYGERPYMKPYNRFPAPDNLTSKYPELTPYQFASNSPIIGIDRDGEEIENYLSHLKALMFGTSALKVKQIRDANGNGNVQSQLYTLKAMGNAKDFAKIKETFLNKPQTFTNNKYATYKPVEKANDKTLTPGDEIQITLHNSLGVLLEPIYVRVMVVEGDDPNSFTLTFATLEGHTDAGYITFSGVLNADGTFEINIFNETRENLEFSPDGFSRSPQIGQWEEVIKNIKGALEAGKTLEMTEHIEEFKFDEEGSAGKGEILPEETITKEIQ